MKLSELLSVYHHLPFCIFLTTSDDKTESVPYVEDFVEESGAEETSSSTLTSRESTPLSVVELPNDSDFDMDVDFE